jgi:hypothetical protein
MSTEVSLVLLSFGGGITIVKLDLGEFVIVLLLVVVGVIHCFDGFIRFLTHKTG